jgi:hypothetical protein
MRRALAPLVISWICVALAPSACGRSCGGDTLTEPNVQADAQPDVEVRGWEVPDGKVPFQKPKVPVPENLRGVWHLPNPRGAIDLELHEDAMVVWRLSDCICAGGGCARWESAHGATEVRADYGWRLYWPTGVYDERKIPQSVEVRRVHLSINGDKLTATFDPMPSDDGGATVAIAPQTWERGGVCPTCRPAVPGPLPGGPPAACVPDFMFCPLSNSDSYACH